MRVACPGPHDVAVGTELEPMPPGRQPRHGTVGLTRLRHPSPMEAPGPRERQARCLVVLSRGQCKYMHFARKLGRSARSDIKRYV